VSQLVCTAECLYFSRFPAFYSSCISPFPTLFSTLWLLYLHAAHCRRHSVVTLRCQRCRKWGATFGRTFVNGKEFPGQALWRAETLVVIHLKCLLSLPDFRQSFNVHQFRTPPPPPTEYYIL
jgi:hypothetical protein